MPNYLTDPLTKAPSRLASRLADKIDNPQGEGGTLRGFLAGSLEGAGDVVSDMTSPLGIASSALGPTAMGLRKLLGLRKLASAMQRLKSADMNRVIGPGAARRPMSQLHFFDEVTDANRGGTIGRPQDMSNEMTSRPMDMFNRTPDSPIPAGPSQDMLARALEAMKRQEMVNAARQRPARARAFRSNSPSDY